MKRGVAVIVLTLLAATASAGPPKSLPTKPNPPAERPAGDQTAIEPAPAATPTEPAVPGQRAVAVAATMMVKVVHPDEVRAKAVAKAKAFEGFPILVSDTELQLKVPPEHLTQVVDLIAASGIVLDKSLQRRDRTEHIAQLEARLRSKAEIFDRLRKFLDDSNVSATLQIERSMTQLVAELENLKGELEVERATTRHALLVVHFEFHKQGRISYVRSPFDWLNSVDLDRFLGEFHE